MAVIETGKTVQPTTINKFLGLNLSDTGDTQIQLGESGNMTNFYITDDLKLRKMHGYKNFYQFPYEVTGMCSAKIKNNKYLFVTTTGQDGGILYRFNENILTDSNVNPEKSDFITSDGETTQYNLSNNTITSIESLKIGKSKITEFDINEYVYSFDSTTVGDVTYPGGTINIATGRLSFNTALDEGTNVIVKYIKYTEPSIIPLSGGGNIGSEKASFFEFNNCLYILCGGYYKYDGTTLSEVEGYTPTVFIDTPPAGGGILYEEINMLSPKKRQEFRADGTSFDFYLAQFEIDSIDSVLVNKVQTVDYEPDLLGGKITFQHAPARDSLIEVEWSKDDGDRDIIEGMRFGTVFGGDVDTRVFLYGNTDDEQQNRVYFSGITYENDIAVPSVEYFPATAHVDIGPKNFSVTDLTRQYDRLLATTNKTEAYYLTISTEQLPVTLASGESATRYVPAVSTFPLNEVHGNVAPGQGRVLDNNPVTFEDGQIIQWKSTNVRDERNMEVISQKIKSDLDKISMNIIKSLDLQEKNQLWVMCPTAGKTKVWIYNYSNKTFSRLELPEVMTEICSMNGKVFMTTSEHKIIKFSETFATYGNNPTSLNTETEAKAIEEKIKIKAYWEMNFSDFGVPYLRKTMGKLWVSLQPQNWTTCEVSFISNRIVSTIKKEIEYTKQWFDNVDFGDWHFTSSVNPQPFRLKLKAKKFTNMKITIRNEEKSACTVLSLALQVESFGYSK